jgi:hypothetical protein
MRILSALDPDGDVPILQITDNPLRLAALQARSIRRSQRLPRHSVY